MIASSFADFHDMAFRNDQYLGPGGAQYPSDAMGLSWDMGPAGSSASSMNSRANMSDMAPFSPPGRKANGSSFASTAPSDGFGSDAPYLSFGSNYGSSAFGSRSDREFRSGSPSSNHSNVSSSSTLVHSSSGSGLANLSMGYATPSSSSRPINMNGGFSRSISVGQPNQTPASSAFGGGYSASAFATNHQYSGQSPSQPSNLNSFSVNALKSTAALDDPTRNSFLTTMTRKQKLPNPPSGHFNFLSSPYESSLFSSPGTSSIHGSVSRSSVLMRGNGGFSSANGSDGPFDEFPSLSRSRAENSMSFANALTQGPKLNYGMSKQQGVDNPEFQMHSEDFPALPGTEGRSSVPLYEKDKNRIYSSDSNDRTTPNSTNSFASSTSQQMQAGASAAAMNSPYFQPGSSMTYGMPMNRRMMADNDERMDRSAVVPQINRLEEPKEYSHLAKSTYVPSSIVQDQFGLFGFLQYMKCLTANASLPLTSVGCDLQALGLVFNPLDATPKRFKGYPFLHSYIQDSCTAHICHLDVDVPPEYLISLTMPKEKITPPRLNKFSDDLLFYLFYGFPGDVMQYAAAMELYTREWRYHREEKVWLTRIPAHPPLEKTAAYERGQYQYFDSVGWRKATKEMLVEYSKLEDRANFPVGAAQLMPQFLQTLCNVNVNSF